MYQNILVPLDGSDNSYMALKHAVKLAQMFQSKLFLVNVIDITRLNAYSPAAYGGTLYTNLLKVAKDNSQDILDRGQQLATDAQVEALPIQVNSSPKASIATDLPKKYAIDLIVMGKSGTNAVSRILLGSTTAYVVQKAEVNVAVINTPDDTD
ncbi:universal stress protein [Lactiplantibacillus paraplantarum]|uniref:universal stress protein n=1 Tax=Lactiplantibacillus paraplantarum TaxID=60520 RepID=UPI0005141CEB|nr:universal stress protein [Lactiplantibacillus paraplantarum]ALO04134.1 universal stress protein UspA [Lactiplantibacillus paraplantarum]KGE74525.1 universal stress protein UspA [Lactiplantibacillus paraplantarum]MCW1910235.1 universal stress protein [Lactiplantibacillus paraplantarum]OAX75012.1 universal stress protein UspA [Lactiplantibacillus plantarum]